MSTQISKNKIYVLSDEMTALGLKLSGIGNTIQIDNPTDAGKYLVTLAKDERVAIIIVTENIASANSELIIKISTKPWPVIVEIPGPEGLKKKKESAIQSLVKNALGVDFEI